MVLRLFASLSIAAIVFAAAPPARAAGLLGADEGKFQLTAGFTDIEGAGGGGLVPFAFITGYESNESWGANAHYTTLRLRDFDLHTYGAAVGLFDRLELSYAKQNLNVTGTSLNGVEIAQDVYGAKVRLIGDALYAQDSVMPQIAVGAEYKRNDGIRDGATAGLGTLSSVTQLGAESAHGLDYYLAATKVLLQESLVLNVALRYTKADEFGLLGFGGDLHRNYAVEPSGTLAYLVSREIAVGAEYRSRPHNLSTDDESNAWDAFVGWTPTKNISLVLAYVDLGGVLAPVTSVSRRQYGGYLSIQAGL